MQFIWDKNTNEQNSRICFKIINDKNCDKLSICAVDFYQIFTDGKLISYGPERTAAGFARKRIISIRHAREIIINHFSAQRMAKDYYQLYLSCK